MFPYIVIDVLYIIMREDNSVVSECCHIAIRILYSWIFMRNGLDQVGNISIFELGVTQIQKSNT